MAAPAPQESQTPTPRPMAPEKQMEAKEDLKEQIQLKLPAGVSVSSICFVLCVPLHRRGDLSLLHCRLVEKIYS